ncbi:hypothetical protein PPERSA_10131 [Pseudocohnilembus persalinus]|uniref:Cysteine protease n=1 Tax=Pseudocohnilembus persalinus TaxID=266149 RepID=A0A0V0QZW2_PSEPJ|nr:hypothetical protein PPERSA_10131 [Pseudocohnilembus persalinus]|eukprot:KRX07847.1 hypothetical protein PPERSA_10131 [Pseudocohnilembus persalinus]
MNQGASQIYGCLAKALATALEKGTNLKFKGGYYFKNGKNQYFTEEDTVTILGKKINYPKNQQENQSEEQNKGENEIPENDNNFNNNKNNKNEEIEEKQKRGENSENEAKMKQIQLQELNDKFHAIFQQIIWFTYRKNVPKILGQLDSDNGWGCMIRTGQMIYAEALRRFIFKEKANVEIKGKPVADYKLILLISLFQDSEIFHYSIQNIAVQAFKYFQLIPGQWYTPNRICYILKVLHEKFQDIQKTKKQRKKQENYKTMNIQNLMFFNQSNDMPLICEQILQYFCGKDAQVCENVEHIHLQKKQKRIYPELEVLGIKQDTWEQPIVCQQCHKSDKSLVLFLSCRIGVERPQPEYLKILNKLVDIKYSIGIIGGRPKQALYFPGRINDSFVYLDPHYVQDGSMILNGENIKKKIPTFFTNKIQTIPIKDIDSSLAFGFYFENLSEFEEFYQILIRMQKQNPDFFLWIEKKKPSYLSGFCYDEDDLEEEYSQSFKDKIDEKFTVIESEDDIKKMISVDSDDDDISFIFDHDQIEELQRQEKQNEQDINEKKNEGNLTVNQQSEQVQNQNNGQDEQNSPKIIQKQMDSFIENL